MRAIPVHSKITLKNKFRSRNCVLKICYYKKIRKYRMRFNAMNSNNELTIKYEETQRKLFCDDLIVSVCCCRHRPDASWQWYNSCFILCSRITFINSTDIPSCFWFDLYWLSCLYYLTLVSQHSTTIINIFFFKFFERETQVFSTWITKCKRRITVKCIDKDKRDKKHLTI